MCGTISPVEVDFHRIFGLLVFRSEERTVKISTLNSYLPEKKIQDQIKGEVKIQKGSDWSYKNL